MLTIILLLPAFIIYGVILVSYKPQSKIKNGILFGIALPANAENDTETQEIRHRYDKRLSRASLGVLGALVPFVFLYEWYALQFIYFLLWLTALIILMVSPFRRAFRDTLDLKRKNGWDSANDDEAWANGFTYHNPRNPKILIPKRIGAGLTVNTGTRAGKMIVGSTVATTAAILLGVCYLIIRAELTSPALTLTPEQRVEIDYPMYAYNFDIGDILEISLIDQVPSGSKTKGEATGKYARGHFRLKGLGKTRLYIFKHNPPYIRFKLENAYIIYNDEDPARTKQLFDSLQREVERSR